MPVHLVIFDAISQLLPDFKFPFYDPLINLLSVTSCDVKFFRAEKNEAGTVSTQYAATRCNKWVGSEEVYGKLCITHGFGAKADKFVVCGEWAGTSTTPAKLCNTCGFGGKANNCARMK